MQNDNYEQTNGVKTNEVRVNDFPQSLRLSK